MNTIPLAAVTASDLHVVARAVLANRGDSAPIHAFLARLDWSHSDDAPCREQVALLEGWTADYDEGLLPRPEYLARLLQTLPEGERAAS